MMNPTEPLWTLQDVADACQVSRTTVKRWRRRPDFPAPVKLGSTVRWQADDVRRWAEAQQERPTARPAGRPVGRGDL